MFVTSVLRRLIADNYALTALPIDITRKYPSIAIVTLKNRTLSPVVERRAPGRDVDDRVAALIVDLYFPSHGKSDPPVALKPSSSNADTDCS
jgi:hypothetical protein